MFLGYRLKALRNERHISQSELGNLLGVTKVSVCGYEKGTRIPSIDVFVKILDIPCFCFDSQQSSANWSP